MKESDLLRHFPRLWHMAEDGSLDSIMKHGLLSTSSLLDLYGIVGKDRHGLEAQRRPESVRISKEDFPNAVIRDQKPMTESALAKCLDDGLTPEEWFKILNQRTFFWLSRERLDGLLRARAYRKRPQTVLTVDTESLVNAHRERIELSPLNSGATIYNPQPRGRRTFVSIADYPFEKWCKKRPARNAVVELVAREGVPDIREHLIAAHRVYNGKKKELWRRPGTRPDDGI